MLIRGGLPAGYGAAPAGAAGAAGAAGREVIASTLPPAGGGPMGYRGEHCPPAVAHKAAARVSAGKCSLRFAAGHRVGGAGVAARSRRPDCGGQGEAQRQTKLSILLEMETGICCGAAGPIRRGSSAHCPPPARPCRAPTGEGQWRGGERPRRESEPVKRQGARRCQVWMRRPSGQRSTANSQPAGPVGEGEAGQGKGGRGSLRRGAAQYLPARADSIGVLAPFALLVHERCCACRWWWRGGRSRPARCRANTTLR